VLAGYRYRCSSEKRSVNVRGRVSGAGKEKKGGGGGGGWGGGGGGGEGGGGGGGGGGKKHRSFIKRRWHGQKRHAHGSSRKQRPAQCNATTNGGIVAKKGLQKKTGRDTGGMRHGAQVVPCREGSSEKKTQSKSIRREKAHSKIKGQQMQSIQVFK